MRVRPQAWRYGLAGNNSGGGSFNLLLYRLPIPWQQFVDPLRRMIGKFREYVGEPGLWIDVIELAGFDQLVDGGGPVATFIRTCECLIGAAYGDAAQGAFGRIVGEEDTPVVEEARESAPPVQVVVDGLGDFALRGAIALFVQPGFLRKNERL